MYNRERHTITTSIKHPLYIWKALHIRPLVVSRKLLCLLEHVIQIPEVRKFSKAANDAK